MSSETNRNSCGCQFRFSFRVEAVKQSGCPPGPSGWRVPPLSGSDLHGRGRFVMFGVLMFKDDAVMGSAPLSESPLQRLLEVSRYHRLHPGLVLVGLLHMDPEVVLDLRWPMVHLDQGWLQTEDEAIQLPFPVSGLLMWHEARQRLDRRRALRWSGLDRVLMDERGCSFDMPGADVAVRFFCLQAGLPPVPFSALRHPCLR